MRIVSLSSVRPCAVVASGHCATARRAREQKSQFLLTDWLCHDVANTSSNPYDPSPPPSDPESQVTSLHFINEETLAAIGGDDKNTFLVWDLATGHSIFKGSAGGTPVYLVRSIHGWADSGGCDGGCPPLELCACASANAIWRCLC
jgi:hypothetical protein